jgi:hypothetical protein
VKAGKYAAKGVDAAQSAAKGADAARSGAKAANGAQGAGRGAPSPGKASSGGGGATGGAKASGGGGSAGPAKAGGSGSGAGKAGGGSTAASRGGNCVSNSFVPGTAVLMADGSYRDIEDVRLGDEVLATDPETGVTASRPVTALIEGDGEKKLVEITVDTDGDAGDETGSVVATDGHPFWVDDDGAFVDAADLAAGDEIRTPDGDLVEVVDTEARTESRRVHNLTVEGIHTYYVRVGTAPVLVHNCANEVGKKVSPWGKGDLQNAVHNQRIADGPKGKAGNYGAARLDDGSVITGRSGGKRLHTEQDLINKAGGKKIIDLYTERAPCAYRCQDKVAGMNVTWAFPWNGANKAETAKIREQSTKDLKKYVQQLTG